jgi:hypothetical protein
MLETLKQHWQAYLMEALGLAGFVLGAGCLAVFLEHPDFPAMRSSFGGEENAIWTGGRERAISPHKKLFTNINIEITQFSTAFLKNFA